VTLVSNSHLWIAPAATRNPMRGRLEDGRIRRIGASSGRRARDARVIDCQGRTLMPGLLDATCTWRMIDLDATPRPPFRRPCSRCGSPVVIEATLGRRLHDGRDAAFDWGSRSRPPWIDRGRGSSPVALHLQTGGHGDHRDRTSRATFPVVPG